MKVRPFFQRLAIGAVVGLIATIAYRSIQFVAADRAQIRHECWTWTWLPFYAGWIWPYLSMFVLVGLPWFFAARPSVGLAFCDDSGCDGCHRMDRISDLPDRLRPAQPRWPAGILCRPIGLGPTEQLSALLAFGVLGSCRMGPDVSCGP